MRALVLSGGGAKGAFQVGALQHLLGNLGIEYSAFSGVSVGAINASFLSMYPKGLELNSIGDLSDIWEVVDDDSIYKIRYSILGKNLSAAASALTSHSLYNSKPLNGLIRNFLDIERVRLSGKKLRIGATSVSTNEMRYWTEESDDIVDAVIASSAFPGFFEPVSIDGQLWLDGGVREVVPIKPVLNLGITEIDIIVTSPDTNPALNIEGLDTIDATSSVIDFMTEELAEKDLKIARLVSHNLGIKLRILRPNRRLLFNPLDFDPVKIQKNIKLGYDLAQRIDWYG